MGQRGTTNCLLNFGEDGECLGYLIGEPHRGLEYMFHMMNKARIGVGHAAVMSALGGYLYSAEYARTRAQGRPIGQKDPTKAQVRIIEHADVRRMLMAQKAAVEGAQSLCLYCAMLIDALVTEDNPDEAKAHAALLGLLTPLVKSWPAEHCLEANKWAIQVLGGYGYTRDYPVERLYRDNRLNHIHEGTFGMQGMDLLSRKIIGDRGEALDRLVHQMRNTVVEALREECLGDEAGRMTEGLEALSSATRILLSCRNPELRLANATIYLDAFWACGHRMDVVEAGYSRLAQACRR
jgi:alkylation response protein AidB-like acyl-CoA dehydrogenase